MSEHEDKNIEKPEKHVEDKLKEKELEIQLQQLANQRKLLEILEKEGPKIVEIIERYYSSKTSRLVLPAYLIVGLIVGIAGALSYQGKISGETFAFLAGSVVGYLIALLGKEVK